MDVHDKPTRSYNMSRIKGKNTKPEMLVRNIKEYGMIHDASRHHMCIETLKFTRHSTPAGVVPSFLRFFSVNIQIPDNPGQALRICFCYFIRHCCSFHNIRRMVR